MARFTRAFTASACIIAVTALAACSPSNTTNTGQQSSQASTSTASATMSTGGVGSAPYASATLKTQDGKDAGKVTFTTVEGGTEVNVDATGLTPGFHGFHIHEKGKCEGDFKSAGGHLTGHEHANHDGKYQPHAGDLPSLLVNQDGAARLTVVSAALNPDLLLDADGSSLIVHEGRDNFANIPERYAPEGPDEDTLKTGDAGARAACGVIEKS